eukprot:PhF_6_TR40626/c1_g2_i7/m.60962
MLSLLVSSTNNVQTKSNCDSPAFIRRLPHDCLNHIFSYCPFPYHAYLVCRSWYHAVDRYVCLGDTFYYLPEGIDKVQQPRWFPSTSLPTLQCTTMFQHTQVVYLEIENNETEASQLISQFESCPSLEALHLRYIDSMITDKNIRGLERLPKVSELDLYGTKITSVSQLCACRTLRRLKLTSCSNLTDDGIRGLELVPTLEELELEDTNTRGAARAARRRAQHSTSQKSVRTTGSCVYVQKF